MLDKICAWKKSYLARGITFTQVEKSHRLYDCKNCSGVPGSCPDYTDYYESWKKINNKGMEKKFHT